MQTLKELEQHRDELKARLVLETEIALMEQRLLLGKTELHKLAQVGAVAVCRDFNLRLAQLTLETREARIAWPRQVLFYLLRELSGATLQEIGQLFQKDHGTVLHACRKVRNRMDTEPSVRARILALLRKLKPANDKN